MVTSLSPFALVRFLKRAGFVALALVTAVPSSGDIIYTGTSVVATGTAPGGQSARATFTVSATNGNLLDLLLENTSASPSAFPADLLTSVYFNVLSATTTGTAAPLSYQSATGQVYLALKNETDKAAVYVPPMSKTSTSFPPAPVPPSNLQAFNKNDNTWQFRSGLSLVTTQPPLAFGIGTVGNFDLGSNNFNGSIVDGFDFGIYKGDVTTQSLDNTLLVRDSIRFRFAGFNTFNLSQVSPHVVFGFGTSPDIVISVPEPATLTLVGAGLVATLATLRRRRVIGAASRSLFSAGLSIVAVLALLLSLPGGRTEPPAGDSVGQGTHHTPLVKGSAGDDEP